MSRAVNDVEVLNQLFSQGMAQTLGSLFGLVGIVVAMLALEWKLALAAFAVIPLAFAATSLFARLARRSFRRTRKAIGDVSANLQEDIAGVKVAQAFNRTQANTERFRRRNAENRDANVSAVGVTSAFTPVMDILGTVAMAIVALYGGWLALQSPPAVTVGVVVAFLTYVQQFFRPIQLISSFYAQAQAALAAAERIFELLDEEPQVVDRPEALDAGSRAGPPARPPAARSSSTGSRSPTCPASRCCGTCRFEVPPGADRGHRRGHRRRQDHHRQPAAALLRRGRGERAAGRGRRPGGHPGVTAGAHGPGSAGALPVLRQRGGQHPLRPAGGHRRRGARTPARTVGAHGFISRFVGRLRPPGGGAGQQPQPGPAPADRASPGPWCATRWILLLDEATASVDTRTEAVIQPALERLMPAADHPGRRPPPLHRPPRRPDPRPRGGADWRSGARTRISWPPAGSTPISTAGSSSRRRGQSDPVPPSSMLRLTHSRTGRRDADPGDGLRVQEVQRPLRATHGRPRPGSRGRRTAWRRWRTSTASSGWASW